MHTESGRLALCEGLLGPDEREGSPAQVRSGVAPATLPGVARAGEVSDLACSLPEMTGAEMGQFVGNFSGDLQTSSSASQFHHAKNEGKGGDLTRPRFSDWVLGSPQK